MKILLLIDANALIHRCFHALPPFTTKDGQASGSLYGLSSILIKILNDKHNIGADGYIHSAAPRLSGHGAERSEASEGAAPVSELAGRANGSENISIRANNKPDYIAAFFDRPEPTFRKEMYEAYKAHRPKAPNELVSQIIEAHNLFNVFGIKTYEIPGFEGDDLIGTAAEKFKNIPDLKIIILTGDADALQLVENDKVLVETFKKGISDTIIYNEEEVKNKYGILPNQLTDYKGLVGDPSDNIKGVSGIGPKTATQIIQKYGTIENFLENGTEEKQYQKISDSRESALLSKKLATIHRNAPLEIQNLEELKYAGLPVRDLISYFEKLGFQSLAKRLSPINSNLFS